MLSLLADISLRWRLRQLRTKKSPQPASWDAVRSVALVLAAGPSFNKSKVDKWIEDLGKYVEVFFIDTRSKKPGFSDWHCFTAAHQNGFRLPRKSITQELSKKHFDVVINAAGNSRFATLAAAAIPAGLHCAGSPRYREADLVISHAGLADVSAYLAHVHHYLRIIRV